MGINGINHFNVAAPPELLERVKDFYVEVLGFSVGERPGFASRGFWLYARGEPLVHLRVEEGADGVGEGADGVGEGADARDLRGRGHLDHVAFSCEGLREFVARLERAGVPYTVDEVPTLRQTQLFLHDPAGVGVELNFAHETLAREESA